MTAARARLVLLSLLLYPFLVWGPLLLMMQLPGLGLPEPIVRVLVFGSMAAGLCALPLLARALIVRSEPAAARLSPLWLAGGALLGGLAAPALAEALAASVVQALGRGILELGLAMGGILIASLHQE